MTINGTNITMETSAGGVLTQPDVTVDAFAFTDQVEVSLSSLITSNSVTITGMNRYITIPITITNGEYSINGGAFTSLPGVIGIDDTLRVRHTSSATNGTATNTVANVNGVTDTFTSTTATGAGVGLQNPSLATNPDAPVDFSSAYPFINIFKYMRHWQAFGTSNYTWDDLAIGGYLDANFWPVSIPPGTTNIESILVTDDHLSNYLGGRSFTLTWEGTGTVTIEGPLSNIVTTANQITFDVVSNGTWILRVFATNPAPDNVRNVEIIDNAHASIYASGERINPDWLEVNSDMRLLRFLNLSNVNISDIAAELSVVDWDDRAKLTDAHWSAYTSPIRRSHTPIEIQVDYANKVRADAWFTLPTAANDAYITNFATYVRDNLNPSLTAYFEISNEVWNDGTFDHDQIFLSIGSADWPAAVGTEQPIDIALSAYGKRIYQMALIVNALYVGIESRRVIVAGGQTDDGPFQTNYKVTTAPVWQTYDPGGYVKPSTVCQALAIAPYYGNDMNLELATLATQYAAGTHIEWMYDWFLDTNPAKETTVSYVELTLGLARTLCDAEGLNLIMYEGLRHYLHSGAGGPATGDALTAMFEFAQSAEDADIAIRMWNLWEQYGDGPQQVFSDFFVHSIFGAWGYSQFYGDTSPYAEAVFSLNANTPNWWGGTGDYRHSAIAGSTDYKPPAADAKPLRTVDYFHVFGHSLFTYDGGDVAPATAYTRAGEWLGLLAASVTNAVGSNVSVGSFTFGFYSNHNSYNWGVPSSVEITGNYGLGNTKAYSGDITNSNYTMMLSMPSNFLETDMGFPPFTGTVANTQADIEQLIDNINSVHGDMPHVLYVHWPNDDNYGAFASNLRADFTTYNNSTITDYLDWHIRLQDAVIAGGRTNLRTFPVGPVIAWLFENESYLQPLLFQDVYGDSAPHGSENIYLLAAMVCYRCIYGTGPDFSNFTIPPAATQIRSEIANNLVAIDAAIRDRVAFHRANGVVV